MALGRLDSLNPITARVTLVCGPIVNDGILCWLCASARLLAVMYFCWMGITENTSRLTAIHPLSLRHDPVGALGVLFDDEEYVAHQKFAQTWRI